METCTHYLVFAAEDVPDKATWYKCAPPLRPRPNQDALWAAVQAGQIDGVASDHSPCPPDMKELETGNFLKAWGGIAGGQSGHSLCCKLSGCTASNRAVVGVHGGFAGSISLCTAPVLAALPQCLC